MPGQMIHCKLGMCSQKRVSHHTTCYISVTQTAPCFLHYYFFRYYINGIFVQCCKLMKARFGEKRKRKRVYWHAIQVARKIHCASGRLIVQNLSSMYHYGRKKKRISYLFFQMWWWYHSFLLIVISVGRWATVETWGRDYKDQMKNMYCQW